MLNDWRVWILVVAGMVIVLAVNWSFFRDLVSSPNKLSVAAPVKSAATSPPGSLVFPVEDLAVAVLPDEGSGADQTGGRTIEEDPFLIHSAKGALESPIGSSVLVVTAVLTGGNQNVAIINNEPIVVGDTIDGLPVIEIHLDHVVLGRGVARRLLPVE